MSLKTNHSHHDFDPTPFIKRLFRLRLVQFLKIPCVVVWGADPEFLFKQVLGAWDLTGEVAAVTKCHCSHQDITGETQFVLSLDVTRPAKNQKHSVPFSAMRRDQRTAITVRRVNSCMVNDKIHEQFNWDCEFYSILIVTTRLRYQNRQVAVFVPLNISTFQEAQRNFSFRTAWCEIFFLGLACQLHAFDWSPVIQTCLLPWCEHSHAPTYRSCWLDWMRWCWEASWKCQHVRIVYTIKFRKSPGSPTRPVIQGGEDVHEEW